MGSAGAAVAMRTAQSLGTRATRSGPFARWNRRRDRAVAFVDPCMLFPVPRRALALWSLCALAAAQDMAPAVSTAPATFAVGGARVRIDNGGAAAVSRDGGSSFALPATDPLLHLRAGTFDPALGAPPLPPSLGARAGAQLFVVQARTAILPEYRDALVLAGLQVIAYLPAQAYVVRGGGDARAQI